MHSVYAGLFLDPGKQGPGTRRLLKMELGYVTSVQKMLLNRAKKIRSFPVCSTISGIFATLLSKAP